MVQILPLIPSQPRANITMSLFDVLPSWMHVSSSVCLLFLVNHPAVSCVSLSLLSCVPGPWVSAVAVWLLSCPAAAGNSHWELGSGLSRGGRANMMQSLFSLSADGSRYFVSFCTIVNKTQLNSMYLYPPATKWRFSKDSNMKLSLNSDMRQLPQQLGSIITARN